MARITGPEAREPRRTTRSTGLFLRVAPSRTALSTDSPTDLSCGGHESAGTTVIHVYCCSRASGVERQTKHGTPATSVAGVYSFRGHPCEGRGPDRLRRSLQTKAG